MVYFFFARYWTADSKSRLDQFISIVFILEIMLSVIPGSVLTERGAEGAQRAKGVPGSVGERRAASPRGRGQPHRQVPGESELHQLHNILRGERVQQNVMEFKHYIAHKIWC